MTDPVIVSTRDIANRLGVAHRTVYQWRHRGIFPDPDLKQAPPLWDWVTVEAWAKKTGRLG